MTWQQLERLIKAGAGYIEDAHPRPSAGGDSTAGDGWVRARLGRLTVTVYGVPHEVVARLVAGQVEQC